MGRQAAQPTAPVSLDTQLDKNNDALRSYPGLYTYTIITTAATTVVFSGAGRIKELNVLGGTLGAVTVYNNVAASGTDVPVPTVTPAVGQVLGRDLNLTIGATVVTAAATLLQVVWEQ